MGNTSHIDCAAKRATNYPFFEGHHAPQRHLPVLRRRLRRRDDARAQRLPAGGSRAALCADGALLLGRGRHHPADLCFWPGRERGRHPRPPLAQDGLHLQPPPRLPLRLRQRIPPLRRSRVLEAIPCSCLRSGGRGGGRRVAAALRALSLSGEGGGIRR